MPDVVESAEMIAIEDIVSQVERLRDEIVELARELVSVNTVNPYSGEEGSPGERAGQELLAQKLRELAVEPHLFEPRAGIFERFGILGPPGRQYANRPNVVATFDFGTGPTVILNSHMDTVGVTGMTVEPFGAKLEDGRIYGRGSSDSKGNVALVYGVVKALRAFGSELSGKVVFESVVDEECSGCGAGSLACIEAGYRGEYAVFVDGSGLEISRGCYGCCTARCVVKGLPGHGSYTRAVSAIDKAFVVKKVIDRFGRARLRPDKNAFTNVGVFRAGTQPSIVPARAEMLVNLTYSLREAGKALDGTRVMKRFEDAVAKGSAKDDWLDENPPEVSWLKDLQPFAIPEDARLVAELRAAYRAALGREARVVVMSGWNDASWFHRFTGAETVLFAAGAPGSAHTAGEYVVVDDMVNGAKVLAVLLWSLLRR